MEMFGHKGLQAIFLIEKQVKYRIGHLPKKSDVVSQNLARITVLNVSDSTEMGFTLEVI